MSKNAMWVGERVPFSPDQGRRRRGEDADSQSSLNAVERKVYETPSPPAQYPSSPLLHPPSDTDIQDNQELQTSAFQANPKSLNMPSTTTKTKGPKTSTNFNAYCIVM
jgi:hypothetical protein